MRHLQYVGKQKIDQIVLDYVANLVSLISWSLLWISMCLLGGSCFGYVLCVYNHIFGGRRESFLMFNHILLLNIAYTDEGNNT